MTFGDRLGGIGRFTQPADASRQTSQRWSLALQGGGSLGAFTWGVLDRLLEVPTIGFDTISGSSAGAVNAALLASGLLKGGRDGARDTLERFWRRASGMAPATSMHRALVASSHVLSPYQFNPFDLNPLRTLLQAEIDFDRLRRDAPFHLLIGATRVKDGSLRLFHEQEVSCDVLLASACLPQINQAISIDGEDYWDGGYAANPPVLPLVMASQTPHILIVQIVPTHSPGHLRSVHDIGRRLDNLTFNAPLQRELEAIGTMKQMAAAAGTSLAQHPVAACRLHRIAAEDLVTDLPQADPLDLDWSILTGLRDAGRRAASAWLSQHAVEQSSGEPALAPSLG